MAKTIEQQLREERQLRQDQRNADAAMLQEVADALPAGHWEKGGLIRAAEILRTERIES